MFVKTLKKLSIPEQKDILYLKPRASGWPQLLKINAYNLCNIPLRAVSRGELINSAIQYTREIIRTSTSVISPDKIIASGHQPIWHHPGLWIKDLAASRFAGLTGGTGLHLIVDHDIVDTSIILPKKNKNGAWSFEKIHLEKNTKVIPVEFRALPYNEKIRLFLNSVIKAMPDSLCRDIWSAESVLKMNFSSHLKKITDLVTYLVSLLNQALGLKMIYLPVSHLSQSKAFLEFTASIIKNAESFAVCYNSAIGKQIDGWKIKPHLTIRPLSIDSTDARIELPFWLLRKDAKRRTLFVQNKNSHKYLYADNNCMGPFETGTTEKMQQILDNSNYQIRPKAAVLTLFVRLFLADWFIHGIGGAKYEFVTDYLLRHYYQLKKIYFGIATTTMTLPVKKSAGIYSKNKQQLKKKIRELEYNPEKFLNKSLCDKEPVKSLVKEKKDLVRAAGNKNNPSDLRNSAWKSISGVNNKLLSFNKDYLKELNEKLELSEKLDASGDVLDYREFFFGLFTQTKLRKITQARIFT